MAAGNFRPRRILSRALDFRLGPQRPWLVGIWSIAPTYGRVSRSASLRRKIVQEKGEKPD